MESSLAGAAATSWWKLMLGIATVPSLIQLFLFKFLCPESPVWLKQKGLNDEVCFFGLSEKLICRNYAMMSVAFLS